MQPARTRAEHRDRVRLVSHLAQMAALGNPAAHPDPTAQTELLNARRRFLVAFSIGGESRSRLSNRRSPNQQPVEYNILSSSSSCGSSSARADQPSPASDPREVTLRKVGEGVKKTRQSVSLDVRVPQTFGLTVPLTPPPSRPRMGPVRRPQSLLWVPDRA